MPKSLIKAIFGYAVPSAHYFTASSIHNVCLEVLEGISSEGVNVEDI